MGFVQEFHYCVSNFCLRTTQNIAWQIYRSWWMSKNRKKNYTHLHFLFQNFCSFDYHNNITWFFGANIWHELLNAQHYNTVASPVVFLPEFNYCVINFCQPTTWNIAWKSKSNSMGVQNIGNVCRNTFLCSFDYHMTWFFGAKLWHGNCCFINFCCTLFCLKNRVLLSTVSFFCAKKWYDLLNAIHSFSVPQ